MISYSVTRSGRVALLVSVILPKALAEGAIKPPDLNFNRCKRSPTWDVSYLRAQKNLPPQNTLVNCLSLSPKKQLLKSPGAEGYCRQWVSISAALAKPLYALLPDAT